MAGLGGSVASGCGGFEVYGSGWIFAFLKLDRGQETDLLRLSAHPDFLYPVNI